MENAKGRTRYIQRKGQGHLETVDEFPANTKEERQEIRRCLEEYRMGDPSAHYYTSGRACKAWKEQQ